LRLGVKRYHFNVGSIISQDPTLILTADEILQYYKESLDVFLETYQDACNWVLLGKLRRYCTGMIPQFACDSPICGAGMHKIHLLPNGDYYPCGSCVNDESGIQKFKLGNIFHPLAFDEYKQTLLKFQSPYFSIRERCETCNATSICDFVCPAFDSMDTQTFENKCDSNQNFIHVLDSYGQQHFQPLLSYYSNCDE
jgi:radical SAM protein with 4Fe4S-binding SPASM domain